ncbi:Fmp40 protein [Saccharomycopsis crataegensis]|uniref:Selenoprotein O n=1 Tax=Saccharomycopsis crataegensis TaxID=43959 RepID=A0AAV5QQZ1_9ASCO|nr:Fmp40 protein [Saccharomycopsis crataegensis]
MNRVINKKFVGRQTVNKKRAVSNSTRHNIFLKASNSIRSYSVKPEEPSPVTTMSDSSYVSLIDKYKPPSFTKHLAADIRVPFAPYHLIPDDLKIPGRSYDSMADFSQKKYQNNEQPPLEDHSVEIKGGMKYDKYLSESYLHKPRQLLSGAFSYSLPEARKQHKFLTVSPNAMKDLNLNAEYELNKENNTYFEEILGGQKIVEKTFPYSQAYAGFQFGQFAGQLGDGRVINLFEVEGDNGQKFEIQLKGAGKTAFSRFADGKAILRSSVREFIISEYLNAIGIPTTRSLAITSLTKTYAQRERALSCAIVARFAPSWVRVGTFDLYRARGDRKGLRKMADYCIEHVFGGEGKLGDVVIDGGATKYDKLYLEIVRRNARTTAMCQVYGFLNGVLNTDNTSIMGLCIDFGPFAIMDKFNPGYTPNSEDGENRYGYDNVPSSVWWNLTRLGEDLGELIGAGPKFVNDESLLKGNIDAELEGKIIGRANKVIDMAQQEYQDEFLKTYIETFGKRLGLAKVNTGDNDELISPMLKMMWETEINYNKFFVTLSNIEFFKKPGGIETNSPAQSHDYLESAKKFIPLNFQNSKGWSTEEIAGKIAEFLKIYHQRLIDESTMSDNSRLLVSKSFNPKFVPSSWVMEEVVETLRENKCDDISTLKKLTKMICSPFDENSWGEELPDVQKRWMDSGESYDGEKYMLQCSCSS